MEKEKQASSHTVTFLEGQLEKILNQIKHQDLKSLITALVFTNVTGVLYRWMYEVVFILDLLAFVSIAAGLFLIFKSITRKKAGKNSENQETTSKVSIEYGSVVDSFEEYAGNIKDMDLQNYEDQLLWETFQKANLLKQKQQIFNNALYVFAANLVIGFIQIIFWVFFNI